jgi:hypothetical protein
MSSIYQAYFEKLLIEQRNSTDKAAVVKYIRRRERRKRAEENKATRALAGDTLEKVRRVNVNISNEIVPCLDNSRAHAKYWRRRC